MTITSPHRFLTEPARPDWLRHRDDAHWYALAAVCIGAFMGQLDASIVTVAFPTLQKVFHASVGSVTWVGLSYLVVLVATVTAVGRLADMVGRKLLYTYGFIVFVIGSGLCALAPSLLGLDACRVVQAVGAAMLQANSVAIIYLAMPTRRVGRALGIQGAAQALGLALGPTVGGLLLAAGGWRLIFLVNIPAGIIGIAAAWVLLPRSRELQQRSPYDIRGLALFVPTVVATLVAVSMGGHWGWTSPSCAALYVMAIVGGAAFVVHERASRAPMLDLSLLRTRRFATGVGGGLLCYVVLFGTMLAVPYFLERGRFEHPGQAGLVLSALPVALGCVAPFAGKLSERIGPRPLTTAGMTLSATFLAVAGTTQPSIGLLVADLALVGVGFGLFVPANNAAIMQAAPRAQSGMASGVLNMTRGLGTAFGLAVTGLVFGSLSAAGHGAAAARSGFEVAGLLLAAVALAAGLVSAAGGARAGARVEGPG